MSTAWNDETRQRVLRAAQELGYTPHTAARALVTSKSYLLGSVLCQSADQVFSDAFLPDVLRGVSQTELGIRESCGHTLEGL